MSNTNKIILGVLAIIVVLMVYGFSRGDSSNTILPASAIATSTSAGALPGLQTSFSPWSTEIDHLRERLDLINLPALSAEGTALHTHQHLDIFVHGEPITVPAGIGINERAGFISPIHTHDATGIIHIESPIIQAFTLGQLFDIWGVQLTQNSLGGYVADASSTLQVYVNGTKFVGNPRDVQLTAREEIEVIFGTPSELPKLISSYSFSPNL